MFTVSVVGSTAGLSNEIVTQVSDILIAAGNYWGRYFDFGDATIDVELDFENLGNTTLGSAGPVLFFTGFQNGLSIFEPGTIQEINTGNDPNGNQADIFVTLNITDLPANTNELNSSTFFLGDFSNGNLPPLPSNQIDLFSTLIHELAHGFGFLSFLDRNNNTRSTFDLLVEETNSGGFNFIGTNAVEVFGGPVPLTSPDPSHFSRSLTSILEPVITTGQRLLLTELDIAVFQDLGIPILGPTSGNDTLFGFEEADAVNLLDGDDVYEGLSGNDTISGGTGRDSIQGQNGNDFIEGRGGFDTLIGGNGQDTLLGGLNSDVLSGNNGNDFIDGGSGGDQLFGDNGQDEILGGEGGDRILGGHGNDTISGDNGDDQVSGGTGWDSIQGNDGNDFLEGRGGFDTLNGGNGQDTLLGGLNVDVLLGGDGNDSIEGGSGGDQLFGDNGQDEILGGEGGDRILGGHGNDTISGDNGDDQISGGTGSDSIQGNNGNDFIEGRGGFDILNGGAGNDTLSGGFNADIFVFDNNFGNDLILDFLAGNSAERIDLSAVTGINSFTDLVNNHLSENANMDAVITVGGNTLTLEGVSTSSLIATDFIF